MRKNQEELERLETWNTNQVEIRKPKKPSRVVFSVAFRRDDFDHISKYAELCGKKTSEFIRDAAIEKAFNPTESALFLFGSGSQGTLWSTEQMPTITVVSGSQVKRPEEAPSLTS